MRGVFDNKLNELLLSMNPANESQARLGFAAKHRHEPKRAVHLTDELLVWARDEYRPGKFT
jgi:hypothetical protein